MLCRVILQTDRTFCCFKKKECGIYLDKRPTCDIWKFNSCSGIETSSKIFDPRKEIVVATDTSEHSISGILAQDGHPIMLSFEKIVKSQCELLKYWERRIGYNMDNK